jgi:type IV secretory pathway VirJ component
MKRRVSLAVATALFGTSLLSAPLPAAAAPDVASLPKGTLVEYRSGESGNRDLAVILSGDGGWADLDRQLGTILVGRGTSVVGFDCMKYFWETRDPDETARDVEKVLASYLAAWGKDRVLLIGFSFGAAVLPFILARMSEPMKAKVSLAVLLGSNTYANWEIHWGDWLHDEPHKSARPVAPEIAKTAGVKLLCVWGAEEGKTSLCPTLPTASAERLELPGGHHFDGNYQSLAEEILHRVPERTERR